VVPTLLEKVFHTPSLGCGKEQFSGIGVVEFDFTSLRLDVLNKCRVFEITVVLGVVAVHIADAIGRVSAAFPAKILLDRNLVVAREKAKVCEKYANRGRK
jgi:hypothetical protein